MKSVIRFSNPQGGGDYSREAIIRGGATIQGNTVCEIHQHTPILLESHISLGIYIEFSFVQQDLESIFPREICECKHFFPIKNAFFWLEIVKSPLIKLLQVWHVSD